MANTKKYVSLDKLSLYDEKIKKFLADADATALQSAKDYAKDYADKLATNYDEAGAAATALADAKLYADGKDAAIQAAQKAGDDAAAAAGVAQAAADKAQGDVDTLKGYVGTFTHDTAKSVVEYINAKTDGIATSGNLEALAGRVTAVEGDVSTIKGDYLKAADKTALEGQISAVSTAVDTEKARAEGIESGLRTDVDAIKGDYLKAADKTTLQNNIDAVAEDVADIAEDYLKGADKTELQNAINAKVAQTDYDTKMGQIDETTESLQTQINTIMNNPDAEGAINSINEFTAYVTEHGAIADGFRTDINKNKDDIAAEVKRAGEAEAALAGRLDVLEAIDHDAYVAADEVLAGRIKTLEEIDHDAYVAADTALKNELEGKINAKADASALTSAVEGLEGDIADLQEADAGIIERVAAVEALMGDGDGSVADQIADVKAELQGEIATALSDAKTDASNKDAVVLAEAQKAATAVQTALDTHTGNADIHVTAEQKTAWTTAANKAHEHGNKAVLDGITAQNITTWNTVTSKAAQDDLTAVSDRVGVLETWHNNFTEASEDEINALFA